MTQKPPRITSLNPVVLPDNRRVELELAVDDLPNTWANINLMMPDFTNTPPAKPSKPDPDAPSPYPNIQLSILNSQRLQVTTLFIIEHMEPFTSLTLHLRTPDVDEQYTARAEMTHQDKTLDVVEVPFRLNRA